MSLQQDAMALSAEALIDLCGNLIDADLRMQNGVNTKPLFKRLRKKAKGRLKRIYKACQNANREQIKNMLDVLHREINR